MQVSSQSTSVRRALALDVGLLHIIWNYVEESRATNEKEGSEVGEN